MVREERRSLKSQTHYCHRYRERASQLVGNGQISLTSWIFLLFPPPPTTTRHHISVQTRITTQLANAVVTLAYSSPSHQRIFLLLLLLPTATLDKSIHYLLLSSFPVNMCGPFSIILPMLCCCFCSSLEKMGKTDMTKEVPHTTTTDHPLRMLVASLLDACHRPCIICGQRQNATCML